jgi:uncharacterized membrane-anchored protein YjiN (DUF445 family)
MKFPRAVPPPPRRTNIGNVSLGVAVAGTVVCHGALAFGPVSGALWLHFLAAGFDAGVVGGLADWFAVTALFRRPLGLPIPHTDIIRTQRKKVIDTIVTTIQSDWLAPHVIRAQLERIAPSELFLEWLEDRRHVGYLAGPVRDVLRALARIVDDDESAQFVDRILKRALSDISVDESLGRWLEQATSSPSAIGAVQALALSAAKLAERPATAKELQWWLARSAQKLRESGKRLVPFFLRRRVVQQKIVEAACSYASSELRSAAQDARHPLRRMVADAVDRYASRLVAGDPVALEQAERLRSGLLESLESGAFVRDSLARFRRQLERDLEDPTSPLSEFLDRKLHDGIVELLSDPARRESFDRWVRRTADEIIERHHDKIGRVVRENLEARDPEDLVRQIEDRVGADLQFIRLNGALVGGFIGLALAVLHWLAG